MLTIILGVLLPGSCFAVYEITKNKRRGIAYHTAMNSLLNTPRVIQLPKDLEREKKRRHIH